MVCAVLSSAVVPYGQDALQATVALHEHNYVQPLHLSIVYRTREMALPIQTKEETR